MVTISETTIIRPSSCQTSDNQRTHYLVK
jgi:hypothetical protein